MSSSSAAAIGTDLLDSIKIALVCQSNLNRSVEAHLLLLQNGYAADSYGAGNKVRLPGETIDLPNVYDFGTPYEQIALDLRGKNQQRYEKNGMLQMLDRNCRVKVKPERWQSEQMRRYQLIIVFDRRAYESVLLELDQRGDGDANHHRPCHVVLMETTDSHAEAAVGATRCLELIQHIYDVDATRWQDEMTAILDTFEQEQKIETLLHAVKYY
jgi:RNA polymerase II subunit A C-terminal domain phosphatase SSU72